MLWPGMHWWRMVEMDHLHLQLWLQSTVRSSLMPATFTLPCNTLPLVLLYCYTVVDYCCHFCNTLLYILRFYNDYILIPFCLLAAEEFEEYGYQSYDAFLAFAFAARLHYRAGVSITFVHFPCHSCQPIIPSVGFLYWFALQYILVGCRQRHTLMNTIGKLDLFLLSSQR